MWCDVVVDVVVDVGVVVVVVVVCDMRSVAYAVVSSMACGPI